jgi:hypothetical protein
MVAQASRLCFASCGPSEASGRTSNWVLATLTELVHADPLAPLGVGLGHTAGTAVPPKTEEPLAEWADHTNTQYTSFGSVFPLPLLTAPPPP